MRTFEVLPAPRGPAARALAAFLHSTARRPVRIATVVARFHRGRGDRPLLARHPGADDRRTLGALLQPGTGAPPGSIAVLPFINMTGDPAVDYLGDGLAEELIHRLSGVPSCAWPRDGPPSPTRGRTSTCAGSPTRSA